MIVGTLTLFIDTNAFLQLWDLKDLPWGDLASDLKAVDLLVAPVVVSELDGHKSGTNRRRRDRSRLALRLIEEASKAPDSTYVLREEPIRVRLVLSNAPRFDWAAHDTLDPARADDLLIAEALSADLDAIVFSHDTGPRIRARALGIRAISPPHDWLLPPEQTDDQRKITQLERQLDQALSNRPKIVATIGSGTTESEIVCISPILPPLSATLVHELAASYLQQHPRARVIFAREQMLLSLGALSEAQANKYNVEFDTFEEEARGFFERLHEQVRLAGKAVNVPYEPAATPASRTQAGGWRAIFTQTNAPSLRRGERSPALPSLLSPHLRGEVESAVADRVRGF